MTSEARQRRQTRTPVLVLTAAAWAATLALHPLLAESRHHPNDPATGFLGHPTHPTEHAGMSPSWSVTGVTGWALMMTAMMAPLLIPALRHVWARSLPRRRWRAAMLLTAAYAAAWSAGGLVLLALSALLQAVVADGGVVIAVGGVAALIWQLSPLKQRCLNRHHAHPPIAAFGRGADLDALRFGGRHAAWCFGSCWALMLLPVLVGSWQVAVMAIVSLWVWGERFDTPVAPTWRVRVPVRAARIVVARVRCRLRPGPTLRRYGGAPR
ncbi:MAG TPA: DUF2182 domain-containing protein [Propionibacteriaceae bacterium]|nr:DUF2182 domain-containing protein [Propionibacteriaceae bacterium]